MIQQSLLAKIAAQYDFDHANKIIARPQCKPFSRSWMAVEFSLPLSQILDVTGIQYACPYQQDDQYYKHNAKTNQVKHSERRSASKADLKLATASKQYWFEFHVLHQDDLAVGKELNRLYDDANRVRALRDALPKDDILLFIGLWGRFNSQDIQHFQPLDNHKECAYVLDSGLTGSGQISRLCQMKKGGEERFLLVLM